MHIVNGDTWWLQIYRPVCNQKPIGYPQTFLFTKCGGQGNDFEVIPTMKMETRHPVEIYFGRELFLAAKLFFAQLLFLIVNETGLIAPICCMHIVNGDTWWLQI